VPIQIDPIELICKEGNKHLYNSPLAVVIAVIVAAALLAGCGSTSMPSAALDLPAADDEIARTEAEARFSGALFRHRGGVVEFVHPGFTVVGRPQLPGFQGVVARRVRSSGTLTLFAYTDIEPGDQIRDEDFLVFGYWSKETDTPPAEVEVFGYGTARHHQETLLDATRLTGTVHFEGWASGLYTHGSSHGNFVADASLVADLGSAHEIGSITGTVNGFIDESGNSLGEWSVDFGRRSIDYSTRFRALGIDNSVYVENQGPSAAFGETSGDAGWKAELYGNAGPDGGPSAVAGTFWASSDHGPRLAGGFATRRTLTPTE